MIAIVDYGVGNLFSLKSSFAVIGEEIQVTGDPDAIISSDKIILPGVGAFEDAVGKLKKTGLDKVVTEEAQRGKPLLGICLGMQLLFEKSYEYGEHKGLGLIPGEVRPVKEMIPSGLKIPHIGWNSLILPRKEKSRLYTYINEGDYVYFVHSFAAVCPDEVLSGKTEYGGYLTASVENRNVYGMQFHPEKSGDVGLRILKAFCELT